MAWTNGINSASPPDTDPAAEGAEQLRTLKAAINERMASRMPGWPVADPLPLLAVDVGSLANRPAAPAGDGHVYIADDPLPKRFYYGEGGAWSELSFGGGAIADSIAFVTGSLLGETIPLSSAHHLVTDSLTALASNYEVVGWRYRWKLPDYSSSFTSWQTTDPAANPGLFTDEPPLVRLLRFEVDRADQSVKFHFVNDDVDAHDVDIEWAVTLLKVS